MDHIQNRINRMNASKERQRKEDEEFIRKQRIRMFINDCDEIRPDLRLQLLRDSKLCQVQQIKDKLVSNEMKSDVEKAWSDIQYRFVQEKTKREQSLDKCRREDNLITQDFLKQQMVDRTHRELKIYDEYDEELKQIASLKKIEEENELEMLRSQSRLRKAVGNELKSQTRDNFEKMKFKLKTDLEIEKSINEKARKQKIEQEKAEHLARTEFKRGVFEFLNDLDQSRRHIDLIEREKEKLIEDIRTKASEDSWKKRCEAHEKRLAVNTEARRGQFAQIKNNELMLIEDKAQQQKENQEFNQKEMLERQKIVEEKWRDRVKAFHYGRELLEQQKAEKLRDLEEKQKLEEKLLLAEEERKRCMQMGHEFVKSYQDVLIPHPNYVLFKKGKKY